MSLNHPSNPRPTRQEACTASCQFKQGVVEGTLDLQVNQRSSDVCVGLPYDIVIWSMLLHLVCREVRLRTAGNVQLSAGSLSFDIVSAHIYLKNEDGAEEVLKRKIKQKGPGEVVQQLVIPSDKAQSPSQSGAIGSVTSSNSAAAGPAAEPAAGPAAAAAAGPALGLFQLQPGDLVFNGWGPGSYHSPSDNPLRRMLQMQTRDNDATGATNGGSDGETNKRRGEARG